VKLLLPTWDPDELARALERVTRVVQDASALDVKVVVEPITASEHPDDSELDLVGDAARVATEIGADILKIPFPGTERLARWTRITSVPAWILGGEPCDKDELARRVRAALQSGASGIAMGRNIWGRGLTVMKETMRLMRNTPFLS
jgi:fructose-bisphosphate aldolase, class I